MNTMKNLDERSTFLPISFENLKFLFFLNFFGLCIIRVTHDILTKLGTQNFIYCLIFFQLSKKNQRQQMNKTVMKIRSRDRPISQCCSAIS